jgi:hypothetical protein
MGMGKVILDANEFWNAWNEKMNGTRWFFLNMVQINCGCIRDL